MIIALGLALWIFIFLYFTEPLDVKEFGEKEKLIYLPLYGLVGAISYLFMMPIQNLLKTKKTPWSIFNEFLFFGVFILLGWISSRAVYLYIIMAGEPNPYELGYYTKSIYLPAVTTILPIVIAGRWAFGKYRNKRLEDQKIEITGEGTYEGLRLNLNELICIKAEDNYIEVSYLSEHGLKRQLIRNKLSTMAETFPELLRTHRSFLINSQHFRQWQSDKGKHFLLVSHEIKIPVSKTYLTNVKQVLHSATI